MSPMADQDQLEAEVRGGESGPTSEEDLSEALDDDKLPADFPPDEPVGSFDYGITAAEQRIDEPIAERVARERPEDARVGEADRVGRLVAPDEGVHADVEGAEIATEVDGVAAHDLPLGDTQTGDSTTYDVATELTQDLSAEEAAVHERDVP